MRVGGAKQDFTAYMTVGHKTQDVSLCACLFMQYNTKEQKCTLYEVLILDLNVNKMMKLRKGN